MTRIRAALALLLVIAAPAPAAPAMCDAVWRDPVRERDVPVRVHLPDGTGRVPAILWSPGLGGTTGTGTAWARGWVTAGFAVVQMQHPGSDDAVYAGPATPEERAARVRAAASGPQLVARLQDARFVMDELARRPREGACDLARIDLDRLGLAGHSMGAWVAQAIAGQRFAGGLQFVDRRPRALVAFSGSLLGGAPPDLAFADVRRPFLAITGTRDGVPPGADAAGQAAALAQRTGPWAAMPADGRKYLLVVDGADHMMFAGNPPRRRDDATEARVVALGLAVTTAFFRRWLNDDAGAEPVLARPPLAAGDRWDRK